jgi:DNA-binding HxlR family transcriptional regulator
MIAAAIPDAAPEGTSLGPRHIEMTEKMSKDDHKDCRAVSSVLSRVSDNRSSLIVMMLREGPRRFNDLKRSAVGISRQMLTRTLRKLERHRMVSRTLYPTVPPQVEYGLTPLGHSLSEPVIALGSWAIAHMAAAGGLAAGPLVGQQVSRSDIRLKAGSGRWPNGRF